MLKSYLAINLILLCYAPAFAEESQHSLPSQECSACVQDLPFEPPVQSVVLSYMSGLSGITRFYIVDIGSRRLCRFETRVREDNRIDLEQLCRYSKISRADLHNIVAEADFVRRTPSSGAGIFATDTVDRLYIFGHGRSYARDMVIGPPASSYPEKHPDPQEGLVDAIMAAVRPKGGE